MSCFYCNVYLLYRHDDNDKTTRKQLPRRRQDSDCAGNIHHCIGGTLQQGRGEPRLSTGVSRRTTDTRRSEFSPPFSSVDFASLFVNGMDPFTVFLNEIVGRAGVPGHFWFAKPPSGGKPMADDPSPSHSSQCGSADVLSRAGCSFDVRAGVCGRSHGPRFSKPNQPELNVHHLLIDDTRVLPNKKKLNGSC